MKPNNILSTTLFALTAGTAWAAGDTAFAANAWPTASTDGWGVSTYGKYQKSLGSFESREYPKLH